MKMQRQRINDKIDAEVKNEIATILIFSIQEGNNNERI